MSCDRRDRKGGIHRRWRWPRTWCWWPRRPCRERIRENGNSTDASVIRFTDFSWNFSQCCRTSHILSFCSIIFPIIAVMTWLNWRTARSGATKRLRKQSGVIRPWDFMVTFMACEWEIMVSSPPSLAYKRCLSIISHPFFCVYDAFMRSRTKVFIQ